MIRQLDVPIYEANVLFLLETTGEEWAIFCDNEINKGKLTDDEIKYFFNEIATDNYGGTTSSLDGGGYVVLIKQAHNPFCFTHELYHCVDKILKERGVEHSDNDEAYAYMVGWINEQYHKILKEFDEENENKGTNGSSKDS